MIKRTKSKTKAAKADVKKAAPTKETVNTPEEKAEKSTSINVYYQFNGIEITEQEITQRIKDNWTNAGHKISEIKELNMYIKPEDKKVYYLINGSEQGSIEL